MWVCSGNHSDSKARASASMARWCGSIAYSVGNIDSPMCIVACYPVPSPEEPTFRLGATALAAALPRAADRRGMGPVVGELARLLLVVVPGAVLVAIEPVTIVPVGRMALVIRRRRRRDELRGRWFPLSGRRSAGQERGGERAGRRNEHEASRKDCCGSLHGFLTCLRLLPGRSGHRWRALGAPRPASCAAAG